MGAEDRFGVIAVLVSGVIACGGSTEGASGAGGGSSADELSASAATGTSGSASGNSSSVSGTGSGASGGGAQCTAASVDMNDPCEVCVVTSCTAEALACCQNEGCLDIVACAQEKGCAGVDCYQEDTCKQVIDDAGGVQIAVGFAAPLGECAVENCAAECGTGG
ncbi:MAG: hypothetical protein FJ095_09390 [Deltaproteobacteria bacterium]|nr:hypothetical protein [Deltaproteobacteria bacterium]